MEEPLVPTEARGSFHATDGRSAMGDLTEPLALSRKQGLHVKVYDLCRRNSRRAVKDEHREIVANQ